MTDDLAARVDALEVELTTHRRALQQGLGINLEAMAARGLAESDEAPPAAEPVALVDDDPDETSVEPTAE